MKDEEMAEEYAQNLEKELMKEYEEHSEYGQTSYLATIPTPHVKQAFLAGLKAGRPQWHTPDARLPEEEGDYLFCLRDGEETMYDIVGVSIDLNGYVSLDSYIWSITDVIAWCEIPAFDKE